MKAVKFLLLAFPFIANTTLSNSIHYYFRFVTKNTTTESSENDRLIIIQKSDLQDFSTPFFHAFFNIIVSRMRRASFMQLSVVYGGRCDDGNGEIRDEPVIIVSKYDDIRRIDHVMRVKRTFVIQMMAIKGNLITNREVKRRLTRKRLFLCFSSVFDTSSRLRCRCEIECTNVFDAIYFQFLSGTESAVWPNFYSI